MPPKKYSHPKISFPKNENKSNVFKIVSLKNPNPFDDSFVRWIFHNALESWYIWCPCKSDDASESLEKREGIQQKWRMKEGGACNWKLIKLLTFWICDLLRSFQSCLISRVCWSSPIECPTPGRTGQFFPGVFVPCETAGTIHRGALRKTTWDNQHMHTYLLVMSPQSAECLGVDVCLGAEQWKKEVFLWVVLYIVYNVLTSLWWCIYKYMWGDGWLRGETTKANLNTKPMPTKS